MMKQKSVEEWLNEGIALRDLGRSEEAIRCYDEALKKDPMSADALNNKNDAIDKLKRRK
jgi:tetratricopeptide (TPR) repeat protein